MWAACLLGAWFLIFLAIAGALAIRGRALDPPRLVHAGGYALWILYGPILAAGYSVVTASSAGRVGREVIRIAPRRPWHAVTFGLILLNGFSPYLGLKTEAAFSMYSNLRTEGPHWNHLLLPARLKLGPYQDDLVSIHASTADVLRQNHERGEQLMGLEFERLVGRLCRNPGAPAAVEYTRNGDRHSVTDACEATRHARPRPWADRFLVFRPVTAACRH